MEQINPIDLVMTTWNRPQFTYAAIDSIFQNTVYPHKLIVIDNNSEFEMQEQLLKMKESGIIDTLILLDHNYGLEYAKHRAMEFVNSHLFISTDNDILAYKYDPCWLTQLVRLAEKYPEFAAIGCRPQILVGTGNIFEGRTDEVIEFDHVPGYLRIMRTDWIKFVGAWKDERPLRGHEEYWISFKLHEAGKLVGWANNVKCWHLFGDGNWGYGDLAPEEHGHNSVSSLPKDDVEEIWKMTGIKI